ncbi:sensor histidine kinase [Spongiactinospora gelatinilytica]|uniref:histidine kinase n=1 Tax=Spongiactinospora gelatinilytica TaxID=2666298 RepID=A0A2W2GXV8_9ACTN|nr:histidine kinase [Spongiactinospora gelatinilytica]PZG54556.1 sensor histidine kinase [Spongiactinospora gelatinilytica]
MTEYRWLLPAALIGTLEERPGRPVRRTPRDWAVDITMFLLACLITLIFLGDLKGRPEEMVFAEQILGALSCAAVWLRRRWPVGLALTLAPLSAFSLLVSGPLLIVVFTVAVHRPFRYIVLIMVPHLLALLPYGWLHPDPELGFAGTVIIAVLVYLVLIAWGMLTRSRRQLMFTLRERADQAAEQARRLERERIAREMHDVLAHRLTLLSLHAGALEFRKDASAEGIATAATAIRSGAHEALQDLREVIGVLRWDRQGEAPEPPQPTMADLNGLLEASRKAGMEVRPALRVPGEPEVPAALGRTVYRVVQEGLTNARKHAPGVPVTVAVDGAPGPGLTVEIRNPARTSGRHIVIPGSGTGLIGLAERAGLAGGRLEHGTRPDGDYVLRAWLPWPS